MELAFEKLPRETVKAFAAFKTYLELGPERTIGEVCKRLGKTRTVMDRWSQRYDWCNRALAYEAHMAKVEAEAAESVVKALGVDWGKRQEEQRLEEWAIRCELIETAREALRRWKARPERCGSLEGIARLLELASKLGRLASGMATDKTEVQTEVQAVLRVELDAALDKIYGVAAPPAFQPAPNTQPAYVDVEEVQSAECKVQIGNEGGER